MMQQALNGMIALMMARFMMNDVPHAAGLLVDEHPKTPEEATFSPEARRDLTFCKHMWDLEQTLGRPFTREEIAQKWENWRTLRYRPKTDEERRLVHSIKYGNEELPPRGSGL